MNRGDAGSFGFETSSSLDGGNRYVALQSEMFVNGRPDSAAHRARAGLYYAPYLPLASSLAAHNALAAAKSALYCVIKSMPFTWHVGIWQCFPKYPCHGVPTERDERDGRYRSPSPRLRRAQCPTPRWQSGSSSLLLRGNSPTSYQRTLVRYPLAKRLFQSQNERTSVRCPAIKSVCWVGNMLLEHGFVVQSTQHDATTGGRYGWRSIKALPHHMASDVHKATCSVGLDSASSRRSAGSSARAKRAIELFLFKNYWYCWHASVRTDLSPGR